MVPHFKRKQSVARKRPSRVKKSAVVLEPERGNLTNSGRAKSDVVFEPQGAVQRGRGVEPQRGDLPKPPRPAFTTEAQRKNGGCSAPQAARADGLPS